MVVGSWGWVWKQCLTKRRHAAVLKAVVAVVAVVLGCVEWVAIVSLTEWTLVVAYLLLTVVAETARVVPIRRVAVVVVVCCIRSKCITSLSRALVRVGVVRFLVRKAHASSRLKRTVTRLRRMRC